MVVPTSVAAAMLAGCGSSGSPTNDVAALSASPNSDIAGPLKAPTLEAAFASAPYADMKSRDEFGRQLSIPALAFPNLTGDEMSHAAHGLAIFTDPRPSNTSGVGPYFNQRNCLGCHQAQLETQKPPLVATPVSRGRQEDGFLLFGDFNPATGAYDPRADAGGPIFHQQHLPGFPPQQLPPLKGGGLIRVTGIRAAPPYIGRGLLEAVPDSEILALADPFGTNKMGPDIRGQVNMNSEAAANFIGASTTVRPSRFGLRAAGPTLFQFMLGGLTGKIGLTTPFTPNENEPALADDGAPDPEVSADDVRDLLTMIRMMAPPAPSVTKEQLTIEDLQDPTEDPRVPRANGAPDGKPVSFGSENRGRILFGADYTRPFGFRPPRATDQTAADLIADPGGPNMNCAGCHTPILVTGQSPANLGAEHLTNKKFFAFTDMLIHHMGTNDIDDVLPAQGAAQPDQWRTTPLMGIGLVGPPFFHDGRISTDIDMFDALDRAIRAHDTPGSESNPSALAYEILDAQGPVTVPVTLPDHTGAIVTQNVTFIADDVINYMRSL